MLDAIDAALAPALVPATPRRRLRAVAARLPFVPCLGLESHLGAPSPRVDLLTCTTDRDVLRALPGGSPLATEGPSRALLDRWVDAYVLEFDVHRSSRVRAPAVFLNLKPEAVVDADALVDLAGCVGGPLPADAVRRLRRCAAAIGDDTQITHVGAMASRANRPLRINVGAASAAALTAFVSAMGWPADRRAAVDDLLGLTRPFAHHLVLAFDVAGAPLGRLGLECYLASMPAPDQGWPGLLAHLERAGLCGSAEAAALLEWPRRASDRGLAWPPARARLAALLRPGYAGAIVRTLNHLKLVSAPGEPLRAKAYLLARHEWVPREP
jgi:hypothetical protein